MVRRPCLFIWFGFFFSCRLLSHRLSTSSYVTSHEFVFHRIILAFKVFSILLGAASFEWRLFVWQWPQFFLQMSNISFFFLSRIQKYIECSALYHVWCCFVTYSVKHAYSPVSTERYLWNRQQPKHTHKINDTRFPNASWEMILWTNNNISLGPLHFWMNGFFILRFGKRYRKDSSSLSGTTSKCIFISKCVCASERGRERCFSSDATKIKGNISFFNVLLW